MEKKIKKTPFFFYHDSPIIIQEQRDICQFCEQTTHRGANKSEENIRFPLQKLNIVLICIGIRPDSRGRRFHDSFSAQKCYTMDEFSTVQ